MPSVATYQTRRGFVKHQLASATNRTFLNFLFGVRLEDTQHILHHLRVLMRAVVGRDDVLNLEVDLIARYIARLHEV